MTETVFKLLMIEDDPAVASSLQAWLELHGFGVVSKRSGEDGIRYIFDHDAHLVLLDVRLPVSLAAALDW